MFGTSEGLLSDDGSGGLVVDVEVAGGRLERLRRQVGELPASEKSV
jgi:hypothetical protein